MRTFRLAAGIILTIFSLGLAPLGAARADEAGTRRAAPPGSYAAEVRATRLNLRAGPGPAYQVVVHAKRGSRLVVVGKSAVAGWLQIVVPGGYDAWASGHFLAKRKDGTAEVTVEKLQVRPRATTKFHQLSGRLRRGEIVKLLDERRDEDGGLWFRIRVPQRIPLFASGEFLKNIGPASLALATENTGKTAPTAGESTPGAKSVRTPDVRKRNTATDREFRVLETRLRGRLGNPQSADELRGMRKRVETVNRRELSLENRERRVRLIFDIMETEQTVVLEDVRRREAEVRGDLDSKLQEIERRYKRRLQKIKDELALKKPRFTAMGVLRWAPDPFGRHPSFRLVEGGKMRYFLIAPDFDLHRFKGKRVGVTGITDPESGTGYETVMIKRIEILGVR